MGSAEQTANLHPTQASQEAPDRFAQATASTIDVAGGRTEPLPVGNEVTQVQDTGLISGASGGSLGPEQQNAAANPGSLNQPSAEQQQPVERNRTYLASPDLGWAEKASGVAISKMIPADHADAARVYDNGVLGEKVQARYIRLDADRAAQNGIPRNFEKDGEIYIAVSQAEVEWATQFEVYVQRKKEALVAAGTDEATASEKARNDAFVEYNDPAIEARARSALARVQLARNLDAAQGAQEADVTTVMKTYGDAMKNVDCPVYGHNADWKAIWEGRGAVQRGNVEPQQPSDTTPQSDPQGAISQPVERTGTASGGISGSIDQPDGRGSSASGIPLVEPQRSQPEVTPQVQVNEPISVAQAEAFIDPNAQYETREFLGGTVKAEGVTSAGNTQEKYGLVNYDRMVMFETVFNGEPVVLAAVLDGVSDHSTRAVEYAKGRLQVLFTEEAQGETDPRVALIKTIGRLDQELYDANAGARRPEEFANATGAFALVGRDWVVPGKIGDAEVYTGRNGTVVWHPQAASVIDHRQGEELNIIVKSLGKGIPRAEISAHVFNRQPLRSGDEIVLTTDGLGLPYDKDHNLVGNAILNNPGASPRQWVNAAYSVGDNAALIKLHRN